MPQPLARRAFLSALAAAPLAPAVPATGVAAAPARAAKIKLSCNLYSFNAPLRSGEMTLEQAIDTCAELGFEAVDPTGYYFPGHPEPPIGRVPPRDQARRLPERARRQRDRRPERLHAPRRGRSARPTSRT